MNNNPWLMILSIIDLHDDFLLKSLIYADKYIEKVDEDKLYHVIDELLDARDDIVSLRKELFNITTRIEEPFGGFIKEIQLTKEDDNETIERNLHNAIKLLTNIEAERDSLIVSEYWNTIIDWFQFIPREMTDYIKSNLNNWR